MRRLEPVHPFDMTKQLQTLIERAWTRRADLSPHTASAEFRIAIKTVLDQLDGGALRVASKTSDTSDQEALAGGWVVHQWVKKAILLSFVVEENARMEAGGYTSFYDKIASKFAHYTAGDFAAGGFRVAPPAIARRGAFIARRVVLMPSFINVGAYIDENTMIDSWATVGSCAQIGKNVHISSNAVIGGVLEPVQANPVIIEDNCFVGACSAVLEGVIVGENSVLSTGVFLSQSTKIFDRASGDILTGNVPPGSVIVPGSLPSADGRYSLYAAVIVKKIDAKTRAKTAINDLLRSYEHCP